MVNQSKIFALIISVLVDGYVQIHQAVISTATIRDGSSTSCSWAHTEPSGTIGLSGTFSRVSF
jgi:hypothetical protein